MSACARSKLALMAGAIVASAALALTGCASNTESSGPGGSTTEVKPDKVDEIANLLPDKVKQSETLIVGTDASYAPNEYKDSQGKIVGFDVDLLNAVAAVLGVTPEYRESGFDNIIPSIQGGSFDMGMSSFTDNKKREEQVDFVDYFQAGSLWAQRPGSPIDPNNACGLKVAVQTATVQDTDELPAKNEACLQAGKPAINVLKFGGQDAATNAVMVGQADAMTADYPVTVYAIKQSGGKLEAAGELFKTAPYGWAVPKGSPLAQALLKALEHVIQTGDYKTILANWDVQDGGIGKPVINGAVN
ncbi:MAG: ABC transporter substrate-binding protein [Mycobacterium sp.]